MKLEYKDGGFYENNKTIAEKELKEIISQLRNYIVTEYNYQHSELAKIWPSSECTLRVIMVKLPYDVPSRNPKWKCAVSYARFGSTVSGGASNLSSGGVGVGFDFETGKFKDFGIRYKRFCADGNWKCTQHPDTHITWKGAGLPNWEFVKKKIEHVCQHIASLDYLGFDVIITPNGLKFCEINTHPAADYEQVMCGPILADEQVKSFYESHGLYQFDAEKFYEMYLKSQK